MPSTFHPKNIRDRPVLHPGPRMPYTPICENSGDRNSSHQKTPPKPCRRSLSEVTSPLRFVIESWQYRKSSPPITEKPASNLSFFMACTYRIRLQSIRDATSAALDKYEVCQNEMDHLFSTLVPPHGVFGVFGMSNATRGCLAMF